MTHNKVRVYMLHSRAGAFADQHSSTGVHHLCMTQIALHGSLILAQVPSKTSQQYELGKGVA